MKNVVFVHSSSELYGSDRSLLNIVKYINKKDFNVHVILPCEGPLVEELKVIPEVTVKIFEVAVLRRKNLSLKGGFEYLKDFLSSYQYLKKYIKDNQIDIVDTNTAVVFPGAIAAKNMGIKSVWHIREIINNKIENKIISIVMQRYADLIVANSKATGAALNVSEDKVRVVYNAVENQENVEKQAHDRIIIGMAGRINRWKGQKLFVEAAEIVHKEYSNLLFKIAGEPYSGEEYLQQDLQEYIKNKNLLETVLLLGQVTNMTEFYQSLDIFILPSIQPEPFGLVVIEAMENKIPVIATNHGGPMEIIEDGIDGYLVKFETADEMAARIITLISNSDKRNLMGEKGQKKKREIFSVSAMVNNIETVFNEAISRK